MSIDGFYDRRIEIRRFKDIAGFKGSYVATSTVDGHQQRVDDRNSSSEAQILGATHKCWVDISVDIKDGDQVRIDGKKYDVVATDHKDYDFAMNRHKEMFLRIYND